MNSGIYGITSGKSLAGRKVKAVGGTTPSVVAVTALVAAAPCHATAVAGATTLNGVRTRLVSIQDRGAVRFFGIEGTGPSTRVEILIDGVLVVDQTFTATSSQTFLNIGFGGGGATPICIPDYVPFDTSFEAFITVGGSAGASNYLFNVDLHQ